MALAEHLNAEDREVLHKIEENILTSSSNNEGIPPTTSWKGYVMQPSFPADVVKFCNQNWEPKDKDVLLASFPKTGTTWMRKILRLILYSKNETENEIARHCSIHLQYLEMGPCEKYKILDNLPLSRRLLVTHLPIHVLNTKTYEDHANKIVYIYRNPRDECVSMFHHFANLPPRPTHQDGVPISSDWNTFFEQYITGQIVMARKPGEGYIDHHAEWMQYSKENPNVYVVAYENLIKDFSTEVKKMSLHLKVDITDNDVVAIQKECAVSVMQKSKLSHEMTIDEKLTTKFTLVRKGQIGEWKIYFNDDQVRRLDEKVKMMLPEEVPFIYE